MSTSCREGRRAYLFEVIAEFDDGNRIENPCRVKDEISVFKRINVTLDE